MKDLSVYDQALAKCDWAEQHIQKLKAALEEFRKLDPCAIDGQADPATGDVIYRVTHLPAIPVEIPLIMGNVLNNLRSALDYVACGLVTAGGGNVTSKTKFPIRLDPKDWEVSGLAMVVGARKEAIEALRRIRPYEGGNTLLYILQTLNNADKHRLLLTAWLKNTARSTVEGVQIKNDLLNKDWNFRTNSGLLVSVSPDASIPRIPLYAGQVLMTVPAAEAKQQVGFSIEVAFAEPGPTKQMPVLITLEMLSDSVRRTVSTLAPFLR